ncbi:MAG: hypothetical protein ACRC1Z_10265 [Waterburya sp.]
MTSLSVPSSGIEMTNDQLNILRLVAMTFSAAGLLTDFVDQNLYSTQFVKKYIELTQKPHQFD